MFNDVMMSSLDEMQSACKVDTVYEWSGEELYGCNYCSDDCTESCSQDCMDECGWLDD